MSGYYAKVSNVSGGKSCVATSAYISREKMKDEQMNHTFNYSAHEHDNTFSNVKLCKNAPEEWQDKEKLWNAVEEAEKGKNARKAKQWILAVPQEMTQQQAEQAVKDFQEWMAEKGMCSQAVIHEPDSKRSASQIEKNKHVHVLATQRLINEQGEWEKTKQKQEYANDIGADGKPTYNPEKPTDTEHRIPKVDPEKVAEWEKRHGQQFDMRTATAEDKAEVQKIGARNRKEWVRVTTENNPLYRAELIEESRAKWAEVCNKHLSAEQQIDHRSYDRQGIDKVAQIHEGIGYHQQDERAEYNRTVREVNENMERMKSQAPETLEEIRGELNEVRESLEHDRDSGRSERNHQGAARSDTASPGRENENERRTPESTAAAATGREETREDWPELLRNYQTAERKRGTERVVGELSETVSRIREQQREVRSGQQTNDGNLERMGRQVQYASGKVEGVGENQRDNIQEQRSINEKLHSIRDRIKQAFENIRAKFKPRTGEPDNGLEKPTSEPIRERRDTQMSAMSRFNEIAANQEKARKEQTDKEKEGRTEGAAADTSAKERSSVLEKLHRYEEEAREGRTEKLQSEQKNENETQQTTRRRGIRR